MWVEQTKEGYRYIEKYKDPLTDKWKRTSVVRPTRSNADKNTAVRLLEKRIDQLTQSETYLPYTLEELSEAYIQWQYEENKEQSAANAEDQCDRLMRKIGKDVIISRLNAPYVRENLKCKPETYNVLLSRFKAMMRWAYDTDRIKDIQWVSKLHPMKTESARVKNAHKYLEHEEITALLNAMTYDRWRLMTELLILSGMRIGEAVALLDSDVTDVITVNKTYSRKIKKVSTAKTDTSHRQIPIQPQLQDCINRIRKWRKKDMFFNGYRSDLLIPNYNGTFASYSAYSMYFHDKTEETIGRREKVHALRHTHVAMLAENGLDLSEIARRVGHSDSKVTAEIYMHVTKKMAERDKERIQSVMII